MFYKVSEKGGTLITATFFDPETMETKTEIVRDYDYSDGSRDNDELYNMPIDENVRRQWLHHNGFILDGDQVMVIKGKKVTPGTVATVTRIKPVRDRYGRHVCDYAVLDNGQATNIENCIRIIPVEH